MNWTADDIWTYLNVKLTDESGRQIIYRQEGNCFVVWHWHKDSRKIGKDRPIVTCQNAAYLIEWLTRMGYEYQ